VEQRLDAFGPAIHEIGGVNLDLKLVFRPIGYRPQPPIGLQVRRAGVEVHGIHRLLGQVRQLLGKILAADPLHPDQVTALTNFNPIFADAPAVKMQKTISSHSRASEAVLQTSRNSCNRDRISSRRTA
jgi:hypothetical protein